MDGRGGDCDKVNWTKLTHDSLTVGLFRQYCLRILKAISLNVTTTIEPDSSVN
jgi:hypothetical protein